MTTTTAPQLTTCTAADCAAEFYLVPARGECARACLDHAEQHMRANGHQNDANWSVN